MSSSAEPSPGLQSEWFSAIRAVGHLSLKGKAAYGLMLCLLDMDVNHETGMPT